jgi:hypothetical protein
MTLSTATLNPMFLTDRGMWMCSSNYVNDKPSRFGRSASKRA